MGIGDKDLSYLRLYSRLQNSPSSKDYVSRRKSFAPLDNHFDFTVGIKCGGILVEMEVLSLDMLLGALDTLAQAQNATPWHLETSQAK